VTIEIKQPDSDNWRGIKPAAAYGAKGGYRAEDIAAALGMTVDQLSTLSPEQVAHMLKERTE
jgi:hypothetical protein